CSAGSAVPAERRRSLVRSDMPRELNPEQGVAVEATGEVFVSAGAGTGKTSVLVERFVRAVCDGGLDVDSVLVITYTRKAAGELLRRRRSRAAAPARDLRRGRAQAHAHRRLRDAALRRTRPRARARRPTEPRRAARRAARGRALPRARSGRDRPPAR